MYLFNAYLWVFFYEVQVRKNWKYRQTCTLSKHQRKTHRIIFQSRMLLIVVSRQILHDFKLQYFTVCPLHQNSISDILSLPPNTHFSRLGDSWLKHKISHRFHAFVVNLSGYVSQYKYCILPWGGFVLLVFSANLNIWSWFLFVKLIDLCHIRENKCFQGEKESWVRESNTNTSR